MIFGGNKSQGQPTENTLKASQQLSNNQYQQANIIPQEKKSIFNDNKQFENNTLNTNRSRAPSNMDLRQSQTPMSSNTPIFQNPMANQNQQLQKSQIQTFSGQQSQFINPNKQYGQYDNIIEPGKKSLQQSQVISLSNNNQNFQDDQAKKSIFNQNKKPTDTLKPFDNLKPQARDSSYPIDEMRLSSVIKIDPNTKDFYLNQAKTLEDKRGYSTDPVPKINKNPPYQDNPSVPFFYNKRVVITGASSGIGRAAAFWFLNSGAQVALVGRDLDSLVEIGQQFPKQALVISCDLSKDDQPYDMATTVVREFGGVDILINAAGIMAEGDIKTTFPHDFDYMLDINLRSVYYISFLLHHTISENRGCIINLSGVYGSKPFAGLYGFCMTKAGVETLTKHLALELAPFGVRVNCISPAMSDTNFLVYRKLTSDHINDIQENARKFNPLHRLGTVDDVGKAIAFLCSSAALHITGQVLKIDGGRTLTSSGWQGWKGTNNYRLAMENEEDTFDKVRNFFSLSKKIYHDLDEEIREKLKTTHWSTTDSRAHISVKAGYAHGDARIDFDHTTNTVEKAFNKVQGPSVS